MIRVASFWASVPQFSGTEEEVTGLEFTSHQGDTIQMRLFLYNVRGIVILVRSGGTEEFNYFKLNNVLTGMLFSFV